MLHHQNGFYASFAVAGSFGDGSPHEESSPSFAPDGAHGHIFPESHHSHLGTTSGPGDTAATSGSTRGGRQTLTMSHPMDPRSHPIQVTADDMGRSLSELDLGEVTPAGDDTAATSRQASQSSMMNAQFVDAPQQKHAAVSRQGSRRASFSGDAAGKQGRTGQHKRSSSGEEPAAAAAAAAATSHYKLPAKQVHSRHVMQEPPLSTRSSYRMDLWDNEAYSSARSYAPSGVLHLPEAMVSARHA